MTLTAHNPVHLTAARGAIAQIASAFVQLIRSSDPEPRVLGHWRVGEVAAHMCLVLKGDTAALAGAPWPEAAQAVATLNPKAIAEMNEADLAAEPQRDLDVLADRIEGLVGRFLEVSDAPRTEEVDWLSHMKLPASAAACHLLEEMLVHGFDVARASKATWRIAPEHAALALVGGALPIITAAPAAFVDADRARGFRARIEVRLRGHERFCFVFDDGMGVEAQPGGPIDVHVSADPAWLLLLMLGRVGRPRAAVSGRILVWGRRPWKLRQMLQVITPP